MRVGFGRFLDVDSVLTQKQKPGVSTQASASNASVRNRHSNGTVLTRKDFHGEQAARLLRGALGGRDVDARTVIDVLAAHTNRQRQAIDRHYRMFSDKGLRPDITDKLGGYVKEISLMLLQSPAEFLAREVHRTLQMITPEINTLIGLLWDRSNNKIEEIKVAYFNAFGRQLEEVVRRELAGDQRPLLHVLLEDTRTESQGPDDVDLLLARKDAQMLSSAGVGLRYGKEAPALVKILQTRSHPHLQEMLHQFDMMSERNMEESIKAEFTGRLRDGLISLVNMIRDPLMFFSAYIHEALYDPDPNDDKLIQVVIARSEIDLADIKDVYLQHYQHKLVTAVSDVTSGGYRRYLIRLLGHYDE